MSKATAVHKYRIKPGHNAIPMPADAKILTVQDQFGVPVIYAEVSPDSEKWTHKIIEVFMTGEEMPTDMGIERTYIGTIMLNQGSFVLHVYERKA